MAFNIKILKLYDFFQPNTFTALLLTKMERARALCLPVLLPRLVINVFITVTVSKFDRGNLTLKIKFNQFSCFIWMNL